jgi:predicted phage terminase large subunit-like protein
LEAATRELERRKASQNLIPFAGYTNEQYFPAKHHWLIAKALEKVEAGETKRLMIFMPPRHGKSELASRRFPAWFLGKNPMAQIIGASYGADLAMDFGREVRNIMASEDFAGVFPGIGLRQDSKAAQRWNTNRGGQYIAAGVCGPITGRGADILLIDDPVKDREEADSEIRRERVWDWYTSTAYTRLMPGGSIILIQTRWHEDDLAGRLLEAQKNGGDRWEILNFPAIDKQGEALWPDWYDAERLAQVKQVIGARDWDSLYQQNPMPEDGTYFKKDWIQYYDEQPKILTFYGASDYAVTADGGDYTVHGVVGVDRENNIYLVDWWRERVTTDAWITVFFELARKWRPSKWGEEQGQIIKSVGPFIDKRMQEEGVYVYREQYASTKDKATRAQSIRGRMSQGKVFFPRTEWANVLIRELMQFPVGKHDDQVDVLSLFGRMLSEMRGRSDKKSHVRQHAGPAGWMG